MMANAYEDADPDELVSMTGSGAMTLRRAVKMFVEASEAQSLFPMLVLRGEGKKPPEFNENDLEQLAALPRFD